MKVLTRCGIGLFIALCLIGCGPRQFGTSTPVSGQTSGEAGGFESVDGDDEEIDTEGVIVSDETDEAWDGIETDGGDDWDERED